MTDEQIVKAFERCKTYDDLRACYKCPALENGDCSNGKTYISDFIAEKVLDLINRQKAEIEKLKKESDEWARRFINRCRDYEFEIQQNEKLKAENEKKNTEIDILIEKKDTLQDENSELMAEVERLQHYKQSYDELKAEHLELIRSIKTCQIEAIKEFAEKITEVFLRYAHLHTYAEKSRTETIESAEGEKIEMQSVWDVLSLKKYEMAEYEEMSELQINIEIIAKEQLLTELEKDFRLLKKEMVGESDA